MGGIILREIVSLHRWRKPLPTSVEPSARPYVSGVHEARTSCHRMLCHLGTLRKVWWFQHSGHQPSIRRRTIRPLGQRTSCLITSITIGCCEMLVDCISHSKEHTTLPFSASSEKRTIPVLLTGLPAADVSTTGIVTTSSFSSPVTPAVRLTANRINTTIWRTLMTIQPSGACGIRDADAQMPKQKWRWISPDILQQPQQTHRRIQQTI